MPLRFVGPGFVGVRWACACVCVCVEEEEREQDREGFFILCGTRTMEAVKRGADRRKSGKERGSA